MIKQPQGEINGRVYTFVQLESEEERIEHKLPEGVYTFWLHGDEKIAAPGEIVNRIHESIAHGTFEPSKLVQPDSVAKFYTAVVAKQKENLANHFNMQIDMLKKATSVPKDIRDQNIKMLEEQRDLFTAPDLKPDMDMVFRPNREQAEKMIGKELFHKIYPGNMGDILNRHV